MRFFATCVLLVGISIGAMVVVGQFFWTPPRVAGETKSGSAEKSAIADSGERPAPQEREAPRERPAAAFEDDRAAAYVEVSAGASGPQPLIIHEGRLLPLEQQEVPPEMEGKLLFLGTEVRPGEVVPKDKLIEYEVNILAVPVSSWEGVEPQNRLTVPTEAGKLFRRVRPTDDLAPGTTMIIPQKLRYRRLDIGDRVVANQLLGIINPDLALADMAIKQSKVEGAEAERRTSEAMREESKRRLASIDGLRARAGTRSVTDEDYGIAKVTLERYRQEEISKGAAVRQAQRELGSALTTLNMHMIRASIDGVIKAVYKRRGEAIRKMSDSAVLQILNPNRLTVEAQVDVQDALPLSDRWKKSVDQRHKATQLRADAMAKGLPEPAEARQLEESANRLVRVEVEASRVEPPRAVLTGHLQEVTCVAVTSEAQPRIVSGGEDHTVRIWERVPGSDRWQERGRLNHHAIVRAIACTGPKAKAHLVLTATATGRCRLFNVGDFKSSERFLQGRHSGPVNAVAFNLDGSICATGGEDRSICLWDTTDGKQIGKVNSAHRLGITSLVFTAKGQLVSAGKDRRLVVWNVVENSDGGRTLTQAEAPLIRSGDVAQLNADPTGEHVLYEDGREVRVFSLDKRKIEGTLQTGSPTSTFATLALYSPHGNTILTNGNSIGRLQLWRAPSATTSAAELRQFVWTSGNITCGAFSPDGKLAVTGTQDNRVLVWQMPEKAEAEQAIEGQLNYVEEFLDTSLKRLTVRAVLDNPGWIIPGSGAAIVVPPLK